jgi:hypothetical protein
MAEEPDKDSLHYQWERFSVNLGFFLTAVNSDVSISGTETGLGVNLNMEDAFGLSTSSFEIRGETSYNFGSNLRSHLRVGYFGLIRNSSKTLEDEISIGDTTFPVGTYLSSRYDLHIIRALYDYAFFQDERFSFSFSGGFYILPVNFSIGTQYIINESAKFIAPLPVIGIRNIFFVTPKILLKQNLEVLYVKTSNFRGSITDLNVHVEYNPFKHFGIGAGFNSFNFNFSVSKETGKSWNFDGSIYTGFTGFLLYGRYYF